MPTPRTPEEWAELERRRQANINGVHVFNLVVTFGAAIVLGALAIKLAFL